MLAELGQLALSIALVLALAQGVLPLIGARAGSAALMASARPVALAQCAFLLLAFVLLGVLFVRHDFSVAYVAANSNLKLPLEYRIAATWGGHEGSLVMWVLMIAGWGALVARRGHRIEPVIHARALAVLGLIGAGFLLFTLLTSSPFARLNPAPVDGSDLNPLLQDPGLIFHPPLLYMGYVGFAVAFAFSVAALLGELDDDRWLRWVRPWTNLAWMFLTLGIALGSWWAYNELGWGGWWFWDPVENASFMPWLAGTALIHSLAVTEKRNAFKRWTVLLSLLAFSLSLLGTFLVRSGVLVSVHAFANDPARGVFILAFLALVSGGGLTLYALRAHRIRSAGRFELLSRETLLLFNNVLLLIATFAILLGTLYPLIVDVLGLPSMSVGPPYFNAVFAPLMLLVLLLAAIGPMARWKKARVRELLRRLQVPAMLALALGLAVPLALSGRASAVTMAAVALAVWCFAGVLTALWRQFSRMRRGTDALYSLRRLPRHMVGMACAHAGLGIVAFGIALTSAFSTERELVMAPGDAATFAEHRFEFHGVRQVRGPNYTAEQGRLTVMQDGRVVAELRPEKRVYRVQTAPMTEAAIHSTPWRDAYAALGSRQAGSDRWGVRLYVKPFIQWLWGGALLMAFGGLLALSDRRYRMRRDAGRP